MSALENMGKEELLETHKKLLKALREAIVCPVCLLVPRSDSVPSCPNGHVTCSSCLDPDLEFVVTVATGGRVKLLSTV